MDTGAMNNGAYTVTLKGSLGATPAYTFLSQPPPSKRRAAAKPPCSPPVCQLPPTPNRVARRPSLTAKITNWALHVQPGSPAPVSPHRRLSASSRRPSINFGLSATTLGIGHRRVPSSPFIVTPTPTTASHKTFDFTALGYNTRFTHMPKTPETPSPLLRAKAQKEQQLAEEKMRAKAQAKEESKEKKDKMIKKIKSLTHLRPRSKSLTKSNDASTSVPPVPPLPSPSYTTATAPSKATTKSKARGKSPSPRKASASKKKAIYGGLIRAPPTLANELALMQFADGGKMEDHIKRTMTTEPGVVGDVYRDGKGGVWWDREEELEYRGLLADSESGSVMDSKKGWVKFASTPTNEVSLERRGSATSNSTLDSDLDPAYMMQVEDTPAYHDDRVLNFDLPAASQAPESDNGVIKPGVSVLCLPSRPFRAARHLRKPEFMTDMQAFGLVMNSLPKSPRSPLFPTHISNAPPVTSNTRRIRKRPAPLKIAPGMTKMQKVVAVSSPGSGVPPLSGRVPSLSATWASASAAAAPQSVVAVDHKQLMTEGKREFLMDSFQPEVSKFDDDSEYDFVDEERRVDVVKGSGLMKRASRLDLRTIFGGGSKREF